MVKRTTDLQRIVHHNALQTYQQDQSAKLRQLTQSQT